MTLFDKKNASIPIKLKLKVGHIPPWWETVAGGFGLYKVSKSEKTSEAFPGGGWVGTPAQWDAYADYLRSLNRKEMSSQQKRYHTNALAYVGKISTVSDKRHAGDVENDIAAFRLDHSTMSGEAYDRMRERNSEQPGTSRCGVCYRPLLEPEMIIETGEGGSVNLGPTCARWARKMYKAEAS